jgi:hypothetical protein
VLRRVVLGALRFVLEKPVVFRSHRWRAAASLALVAAVVVVSAPARAQNSNGDPLTGVIEPPAVSSLPPRPSGPTTMGPAASRPPIEVSVGMGASIDDAGLRAARLSAIPSFYATGGFGQGTFGFDLGVFVNSATGRYRTPNLPVDRLGVDAMLVIRPFADFLFGNSYDRRVLRTLALDVGLGYERDSRISRGPEDVSRVGARVGVHADLPLTPARERSELRLRLTVRRFVGLTSPTFAEGDPVPDTRFELFGSLVVVF